MNTAVLRNILIIAVLAAIVAFIPQGGDTADFITRVLSVLFAIMFVWFGYWLYRQFRTEIYGLGERHRALLYCSIELLLRLATILPFPVETIVSKPLHEVPPMACAKTLWLTVS